MKRFGFQACPSDPHGDRGRWVRPAQSTGGSLPAELEKLQNELTRSRRENIKLKGLLQSSFTEQEQAIGRLIQENRAIEQSHSDYESGLQQENQILKELVVTLKAKVESTDGLKSELDKIEDKAIALEHSIEKKDTTEKSKRREEKFQRLSKGLSTVKRNGKS